MEEEANKIEQMLGLNHRHNKFYSLPKDRDVFELRKSKGIEALRAE